MKVAIIGSALSGNKGAAAMLESAVHHLTERHPTVQISHLSMYPRSDAALNPHANVTVMDASPLRLGVVINGGALAWRVLPFARDSIESGVPEVGAIAQADVMLDQGGITFVDGRTKFLVYNVASVLPALFVGTPVVKCAQALGPFKSFANRTLAKVMLPRMAAIVSRGAVTQEHLDGLGLRNSVAGADLAFTLDVTEADAASADAKVDASFFAGGDVVGISPSQVLRVAAEGRGEDYVRQVADQIDHITEELGRPVYLVAHSTRPGEKTHNNDLPVCRLIHAAVKSPERVLFPDEELSSQELRSLIGRCDLFVASRFHAMVSSLATGVPTLVLGWSHKYREVLDMFGLAAWALPADAVDHTTFVLRLAELDSQKAAVRATLAERFPAVRAKAMEQLDVIDAVAGNRPATASSGRAAAPEQP